MAGAGGGAGQNAANNFAVAMGFALAAPPAVEKISQAIDKVKNYKTAVENKAADVQTLYVDFSNYFSQAKEKVSGFFRGSDDPTGTSAAEYNPAIEPPPTLASLPNLDIGSDPTSAAAFGSIPGSNNVIDDENEWK